MTETTCYEPYSLQSNFCVGRKRLIGNPLATGAFIATNVISPNPTSSLDFGSGSWTVQFYFNVIQMNGAPYDFFQPALDFTSTAGNITLFYDLEYA